MSNANTHLNEYRLAILRFLFVSLIVIGWVDVSQASPQVLIPLLNADPQVQNLSVSRSSNTSRSFTSCSFTIHNYGPDPIKNQATTIYYYLSADAVFGNDDDEQIGYTSFITTIYPSLYLQVTVQFTLSSSRLNDMTRYWDQCLVSSGQYYVYADVVLDDVRLMNPSAHVNYDRTNSTITYSGCNQIDLSLEDMKVWYWGDVDANRFISLKYDIHNWGPDPLVDDTIYVSYFLSNDSVFGNDDDVSIGQTNLYNVSIAVGSNYVIDLNSTQLDSMASDWPPCLVPNGSYFIFAKYQHRFFPTVSFDTYPSDDYIMYSSSIVYSGCHQSNFIALFDIALNYFHIKHSFSGGPADETFRFGPRYSGWRPIAGDWNGDGQPTVGLYDPDQSRFYLKNTNTGGNADIAFGFGNRYGWWIPISGDWNGDGKDGIGLYDSYNSNFYLKNSLSGGNANYAFRFGPSNSNWQPIVGDWNGDGTDSIGLYSPQTGQFYLKNTLSGGIADYSFRFGARMNLIAVCGDWDGDGVDGIGLYNRTSSTFFLKNNFSGGNADIKFDFGPDGNVWAPLAGSW